MQSWNRSWKLAAGGTLLAMGLAACGSGAAAGPGGSAATGDTAGGSSSSDAVYAALNAAGSGAREKAVAAAKKEGTLSLYTSMTADVATAVSSAFTKQFGIKVNVFRGNSETVLQRTLQEASAHKPGADAEETNFLEMQAMSDQGVLADYKGTRLSAVEDTAKFTGWTADRLNVFLPAWNTNLIKPGDEPKSWEDLADPKYKGKIQVEVSDSDWYQSVTEYWLTHGKTQAQVDTLWKGIVANAKSAKGHTTMMELLGAGQTPMNAMNYSYITERAKDKGAPVAYKGADGTTSVPAFPRPNGVGIVKGAAHPNAAWLFYDWMLDEGQKVLVDQHLTPVTKVPGDSSLDGITLEPFDVKELAANGTTWDKKYDEQLRGIASASS